MKLPLSVKWAEDADSTSVDTLSMNVSARGVYFQMTEPAETGESVEIVMTLPHEVTMAGPVRVRCLGRILRTEPAEDGRVGVVAAIERYEFLRGEDAA